MHVVNFGHPLTPVQREQIERLSGRQIDRVIEVPTQLDDAADFAPQVERLVQAAGLTGSDWQTLPLVLGLPAFSPIAAVLLAYVHGRCGYFPPVLRVRRASGAGPPTFEVAELIDLQAVREAGRRAR